MKVRFLFFGWAVASLLLATSSTLRAQSPPAALGPPLHLQAGAEFSAYNTDVATNSWEYGIGAYADMNVWRSLGIEAEGRTIHFNEVDNVRQDTISGGLRYVFHRGRLAGHPLEPYIKALAGVGSGDFPAGTYKYSLRQHDTFSVITFGGGLDVPLSHHLSVRAEYEYETWLDYGRGHEGGLGQANPTGASVGMAYRFF